MKIISKFKISLVAFIFSVMTANSYGYAEAVMYVIPFNVQTYIPVTKKDITSKAWEKWLISSVTDVSNLLTLLQAGSEGEFDEGKVRVEFILNNKAYFIDDNGVVSNEGRLMRIDKADFIKFKDSLPTYDREVLQR